MTLPNHRLRRIANALLLHCQTTTKAALAVDRLDLQDLLREFLRPSTAVCSVCREESDQEEALA